MRTLILRLWTVTFFPCSLVFAAPFGVVGTSALPPLSAASSTTKSSVSAVVEASMRPLTVTVQIQSPPEDKPVDWFARSIAIFGLLVGAVNFYFSYWKVGRDRRLSIEDEFWFRKIITPATIEPMLKTFGEIFEDIPSPASSVENQALYARKVTAEFSKLYPAIQTLSLFSDTLPSRVTEKLSECEDDITEYAGNLSLQNEQGQQDVRQLQIETRSKLNAILKMIKEEHLKAK